MFTQGDVIKHWRQHYLHNMMSSKLGVTLFATASQHGVNFYNFVEFIAKTEEFVVFVGI